MSTKGICRVTDYIKEELHISQTRFLFTINELNFQYSNHAITLTASATNFRVPGLENTFIDIIKNDMLHVIKVNGLADTEFNFDYHRDHFHSLILSQMRELVNWFNTFLYQFNFIDSATISFAGNEIFFTHINETNQLCSVKKYCQEEYLAQFLMEKNIKEIDFLNLQQTLNNNHHFIKNRENSDLVSYYTRGTTYSRTNYEATLENKHD